MARAKPYAVAASGQWTDDEEGRRLTAGEVHAWEPGLNQTVCGLSLSRRSQLIRFAHVTWPDTFPKTGGAADRVQRVCPRCASVAGRRGGDARPRSLHAKKIGGVRSGRDGPGRASRVPEGQSGDADP
jgi:hypothetical protein